MDDYRIPQEILYADLRESMSFSPSMHRCVEIPNPIKWTVSDFLDPLNPFNKGSEPGSMYYLEHSPRFFIRNKSLQPFSNLLYPKGDSIIPINPRVFVDYNLSDGDILLSKDSNVGECCLVDGDRWKNHMISGGILRLNVVKHRYYLYAFLKHPLFIAQLESMSPRGATIRHAKTLFLNCKIPLPNQRNADKVITYVEALMQVIVEKEKAVQQRNSDITKLINKELGVSCEQHSSFSYSYPMLTEIRERGRLDAIIYDQEYTEKIHWILDYQYGTETPSQMGFVVIPGPSLEIKIIRTRIDSDVPKPGFYTLILPTNMSEYGTMNVVQYLGTGKKLPLLNKGDIVFGEAGFQKGRSVVLVEPYERCTTNAHGLYARRKDGDLVKSIFFRCIFNWYRDMRLIDIVAVGGSGGHLSPSYFDDYIKIPQFPGNKQRSIAKLYHNPAPKPSAVPTLNGLVEWHREWNKELGIWELEREKKILQETLREIQEQIINDETVIIPFD